MIKTQNTGKMLGCLIFLLFLIMIFLISSSKTNNEIKPILEEKTQSKQIHPFNNGYYECSEKSCEWKEKSK